MLLRPSTGSVMVGGVDAVKHPELARQKMGLVLGGDLGFYPRATCADNLLYFADLQGVDSKMRRARVTSAYTLG